MSDYLFSLCVALSLISFNHSELNHNVLSELPFITLDSQEFFKTTVGWVHQWLQSLVESKYLFRDIITSPERESDRQVFLYNNYTQSNDFTIKQSGTFYFLFIYFYYYYYFFMRRKTTMDFLQCTLTCVAYLII